MLMMMVVAQSDRGGDDLTLCHLMVLERVVLQCVCQFPWDKTTLHTNY